MKNTLTFFILKTANREDRLRIGIRRTTEALCLTNLNNPCGLSLRQSKSVLISAPLIKNMWQLKYEPGACEIRNSSFCDSSVYCMKGNSSFSAELSIITGGSILAQLNSKRRTCIYSTPLWINEGLQQVFSLLSCPFVTTHVSFES